jgi:DNA-binding MarR family transcriptional regulator
MQRFPESPDTLEARLVTALAKIGLALKSQAQREADGAGLTPTQGQALALLHGRRFGETRVLDIASALAVSAATASECVDALVKKGLVMKARSQQDRRAVILSLTEEGERLARRAAGWPDFLLDSIDLLDASEQKVLLRAFMKMIRTLQTQGRIPVSRMCVTCRFFRPNVYADPEQPHHCAFVDAPFGDRQLRLDCGDHVPAPAEAAQDIWNRFIGVSSGI